MITVFYGTGPKSFFMSKTDFFSREEAEAFIGSSFFNENNFSFSFMLKDGAVLIKGKPQEDSEEYFSASMLFALDMSLSDLGYHPSD
jgi:hypothetical protein